MGIYVLDSNTKQRGEKQQRTALISRREVVGDVFLKASSMAIRPLLPWRKGHRQEPAPLQEELTFTEYLFCARNCGEYF